MGDLSCDICGHPNVKAQILLEGAKLLACGRCAKSGKILHYFKEDEDVEKPIVQAPKSVGPEEEIVEGFGDAIRRARQKKKLTIEQLAESIQERANFLHAIETERLKPTIPVAKKLEKELGIKLIDSESGGSGPSTAGSTVQFKEPTLGDMLTKEK